MTKVGAIDEDISIKGVLEETDSLCQPRDIPVPTRLDMPKDEKDLAWSPYPFSSTNSTNSSILLNLSLMRYSDTTAQYRFTNSAFLPLKGNYAPDMIIAQERATFGNSGGNRDVIHSRGDLTDYELESYTRPTGTNRVYRMRTRIRDGKSMITDHIIEVAARNRECMY